MNDSEEKFRSHNEFCFNLGETEEIYSFGETMHSSRGKWLWKLK